MTAYEYLNALRQALEVLPDEERANAIRYYEDYFLDAGTENEQQVIAELGSPEQVAQQILNDYKELVRSAPRAENPSGSAAESAGSGPSGGYSQGGTYAYAPPRRRSALGALCAMLGALFLSVCIVLPLLASAAAALIGLVIGALALIVAVMIIAAAALIFIPLSLLVGGVVLCVFSFFVWAVPASAVLTLGAGLCAFALGGLLGVGCIKLCVFIFPPLMALAGSVIGLLGRFFHWCAGLCRRGLDWLREV